MTEPRISVVIPTSGRPVQLANCLRALEATTIDRRTFEVVVVADGDSDAAAAIAPLRDRLELVLVEQPHAGPAAARNAGSRRARGVLLAFVDDDCRPSADWLARMIERLDEAPDALIGGRTVNGLTRNGYAVASQLIIDLVYACYNANPQHAGFFASNNMALAKAAWEELGGFNPAFHTAEDRDFCRRWRRSGRRMI